MMRRAILIALITILPLALVHGLVEFTSTWWFGPGGLVRNPEGIVVTDAMRQLDVARALLAGLAFHAGALLSVAAPYASLLRSYAGKESGSAGLVALLRRGWLLSLPWAVLSLAAWWLPEGAVAHVQSVFLAVLVVAYVVVMRGLKEVSVAQPGVTPSLAWVIIVVSLVAHIVLSGLVMKGLATMLPAPPVALSLWPGGNPLTYVTA